MVQEVEGCPAKTAISQLLLKLITTGVRGGTRVPCKNCDFCNFSKTCKKLQKSQFLLKLLNSSGKGGTRVSSKNCDFSKNCKKLEKSQFLLKLIKSSVTGGRRVPSKNWISAISGVFQKNCEK